MPFKSDKQRKFLFAKKPEVAKKFAEHSPSEKEIETSRQAAVDDLRSQGVKEPKTIGNLLNYEKSGKRVGDFTDDEVNRRASGPRRAALPKKRIIRSSDGMMKY